MSIKAVSGSRYSLYFVSIAVMNLFTTEDAEDTEIIIISELEA